MTTVKHKYIHFVVKVTDETILNIATKYVNIRSRLNFDVENLDEDPRFKNLGFTTEKLKDLIKEHTQPVRVSEDTAMRDIYRSDLGELLLALYFDFEEKIFDIEEEETFIIPIKNIWDREHNDMPGRGLDVIGYKENGNSLQILIGESKVSEEKSNPPAVVHQNEDSIYKSQKKYVEDSKNLSRRLANFAKKLNNEDGVKFSLVLIGLETGIKDFFEIVYGCCLVRDHECINTEKDYGKLKTNNTEFDPDSIYFIIPEFDKPIKETVDLFHAKVNEIIAS